MTTLQEHEADKFTQQSQVKITGIGVNRIVNTYDIDGNITRSYEYIAKRETTYVDITSGIINTTAFRFYSSDNTSYYTWFNVDGLGTDPALSGTSIQVVINSASTNQEKVQAIVDAINTEIPLKVKAKVLGTYFLSITDMTYGICTAALDINSGLSLTRKIAGTAYVLVAETQISYVDGNPTEIIKLEH